MLLLVLLAVPIVVGVATFFLGQSRITLLELAIQLLVVCGLMIGGYYLTRWGGIQDYELWNGRIASKPSGGMGCCHSYECNCSERCSGTGKDRKCQRVCQTCYRHGGDSYYEARTSNDELVYESRCDTSTPSDWSAIRIGDPTVVEHRYTNYIKADSSEHIKAAARHFDDKLPAYPPVISRWKARRFLAVGVTGLDTGRLDYALDELNADLGAKKQVNTIVVVVDEPDPVYADALAEDWLGGKKNDVVLVIGTPAFPTIAWARVIAWNRSSGGENEFKGVLSARIEGLGSFDGDRVLAILREEIERGYERRAFSDFEYLMARAKPPGWAVALLFGVGLCASGLLHWLFWRNRRQMLTAPHVSVRAWWRRFRPAPVAQQPAPVITTPAPVERPKSLFDELDIAVDSARGDLLAILRRRAGVSTPTPVPKPRLLVSIQTIDAIQALDGADRVVLARIGDRDVVVRKGLFEPGDRCVLFEEGAVLPKDRPWAAFMKEHRYRVRRREMFGVESSGLALPLDILDGAMPVPGVDLRDLLGVKQA
jgi:hypothetical protein